MAMLTLYPPKVSGLKYRAWRFLDINHPIILRRSVARHRSLVNLATSAEPWNPVYERWLRTGRKIHQPIVYWDSRRGWSRVFQIVPMVLIRPGSSS